MQHSYLRKFAAGVMTAAALVTTMGTPAMAEAPLPLTCLLVPAQISDIGSDRVGIVRDVTVRRADYVAAGDALLLVDAEVAKSDLEVAQISIGALQERLERSEGLLARSLISQDEIGTLRADLALAKASATRAQMEIDRATIRAPFAGYVAEVDVAVGELIGPDPLLRLIDVTTLHAELVFLAGAYGQVALGDVMEVQVADAQVEATVFAIDPFIEPTSNAFTVMAEIANQDLSLPAGTSCHVVN
ncbi:MAG: efflux RND transporter periplasmic adaptor subunit [Pseudomonadota bacterium]|nr:efflux RND transporter periplasmic adaptor subunit [Pseudomonadota bacterium]